MSTLSSPPTMQSKSTKPSWIRSVMALQSAAALSTLVFYPMDVVKMRFMSQDGTEQRLFSGRYYNSTWATLNIIYKEEGFRTLFRGSHVSILGALVSWGVYMGLYQYLTTALPVLLTFMGASHWITSSPAATSGGGNGNGLSLNFVCSCVASIASAVAGNPIWMVKTRMQLEVAKHAQELQQHQSGSASSFEQPIRRYPTLRGGLLFIYQDTGFKSLYRGLNAQVLLSLPNAMTFPLYEWMKAKRRTQLGLSDGGRGSSSRYKNLSLVDTCMCSVTSKVCVSIFSHPLVVIKTRLMDERSHLGSVKYRSVGEAVGTMAKREKLAGFFRGMGPSMLQSVPRATMHFSIYETLLHWGQK